MNTLNTEIHTRKGQLQRSVENTKKLLHNNKFGNSKRRVLLLVACQGESHKTTLSHSYSAAVYIFVLVLMPFKETETCTKRQERKTKENDTNY